MTDEPPTVLRPGSGSYRHIVDVGEDGDELALVVEATDDPDAPIGLTVSLDWTTLRETTVSEEFFSESIRAADVATGAGRMAARLREDVDKADATDAVREAIADVGSLIVRGEVVVADDETGRVLRQTESVELDPDAGEVVVTLDESVDPRELRIERAQLRVPLDEWATDDPPAYPGELVGIHETSPFNGDRADRHWRTLRRAWMARADVVDAVVPREESVAVSSPADVDRLAAVGFPVTGAEFIDELEREDTERLRQLARRLGIAEVAARRIVRGLGATDELENVEPRANQPTA